MKFIQGNYFDIDLGQNKFDGIITDPPYKNSIKNKLSEKEFDIYKFIDKINKETKEKSFLILFCNLYNLLDLIRLDSPFKFHTYQVWDKSPTRNFISWRYPLRSTEFIAYFIKGNYQLCFKNGSTGKPYNRNHFQNKGLIKTTRNTMKISYGMYPDIIHIPTNKMKRKHPTEKPIYFSEMFSNIVGHGKYVLDCFCGSGNLLNSFPDSIGVDIINWQDEKVR